VLDEDEILALVAICMRGGDPSPQLARLDADQARMACGVLADMLAAVIGTFGVTPELVRQVAVATRMQQALGSVT
jgi:hypothetical protein